MRALTASRAGRTAPAITRGVGNAAAELTGDASAAPETMTACAAKCLDIA